MNNKKFKKSSNNISHKNLFRYPTTKQVFKECITNFGSLNSKKRDDQSKKLYSFPIGLIIISKEEQNPQKQEEKIEFINSYALNLIGLRQNCSAKELYLKLSEFRKVDDENKFNYTLNEILEDSVNNQKRNFEEYFAFFTNNIILLYVKINFNKNKKYICIDNYNREHKYIEKNIIKSINSDYLNTLYHELNNPLNALLSLTEEKLNCDTAFDCSNVSYNTCLFSCNNNINNININNNNKYDSVVLSSKTKSLKKNYTKAPRGSVSPSCKNNIYDTIFSRNTMVKSADITNINNYYANLKNELHKKEKEISLYVNMIKIFTKNFILYFKIRYDSDANSDDSSNLNSEDIGNNLTSSIEIENVKLKNFTKINLEYIFDAYTDKFSLLYTYKNIDYHKDFKFLRDKYIVTDRLPFSFFIRQIFTYLYYSISKREGFIFLFEQISNNKLKIIIKNTLAFQKSKIRCKLTSTTSELDKVITQNIKTKRITKEIIYALSKRLNINVDFYENNAGSFDDINIMEIILPYMKKDKNEEEDDFKEEDIDEMPETNNRKNMTFLEEVMQRQLPLEQPIPESIDYSNRYGSPLSKHKKNNNNEFGGFINNKLKDTITSVTPFNHLKSKGLDSSTDLNFNGRIDKDNKDKSLFSKEIKKFNLGIIYSSYISDNKFSDKKFSDKRIIDKKYSGNYLGSLIKSSAKKKNFSSIKFTVKERGKSGKNSFNIKPLYLETHENIKYKSELDGSVHKIKKEHILENINGGKLLKVSPMNKKSSNSIITGSFGKLANNFLTNNSQIKDEEGDERVRNLNLRLLTFKRKLNKNEMADLQKLRVNGVEIEAEEKSPQNIIRFKNDPLINMLNSINSSSFDSDFNESSNLNKNTNNFSNVANYMMSTNKNDSGLLAIKEENDYKNEYTFDNRYTNHFNNENNNIGNNYQVHSSLNTNNQRLSKSKSKKLLINSEGYNSKKTIHKSEKHSIQDLNISSHSIDFSSFHPNSKKTIENYKLVQNTSLFLDANKAMNLDYSPKTIKN